MKAPQDLTQLTIEELYARKQKLQGAIIGLGIVMGVALAIILYVVILKKRSYGLLVVGSAAFVTLMPGVVAYNQIREELKRRQAPQ
ncbi:hypothetical protein KBK19_12015 [Microvirga sp. STR05]|uniref:Redox-active disulfide protein 2 n=1 Tax=Hymenobacter duratus TaxID=2771356 RepID=A0ABR8JFW0_9BACT|nr:hypothetical protein [Hymenobacter duratus]MBD2715761.1 hypothetical protein [Hymenobacter duratus]MBR7950672.1 hypothetical protein [Microvirga sp. STR05]